MLVAKTTKKHLKRYKTKKVHNPRKEVNKGDIIPKMS